MTSNMISFPLVPTSIERSNKFRGNTGNVQELCFFTFLETTEKIVKENFKIAFYKIRVLLNSSKKNNLKKTTSEILNRNTKNARRQQW